MFACVCARVCVQVCRIEQHCGASPSIMKVFAEDAVKHNPRFFLAGRGGETNLHKANCEVRRIVLGNAQTYASLSPRERGQKFSRSLLEDDLAGFTFVVKLSYFWKNFENGKIAANKLESVVSEHGSIEALEGLAPSAYVTIGEAWCLNIIGAILRQASCKLDTKKAKPATPPKSKLSRRRACSKRKTRVNARIRDQEEDETSQNSAESRDTSKQVPEAENTRAPSPVLTPEEIEPLPLVVSSTTANTNQTRGQSPKKQPSLSELKAADPAASFKTGRVSFCIGSSASAQPMSLREAMPFFPIRERNTRFVSLDALPDFPSSSEVPEFLSSSAVVPADSLEPIDLFDVILDDWDTDKWPQLDMHDLLSV